MTAKTKQETYAFIPVSLRSELSKLFCNDRSWYEATITNVQLLQMVSLRDCIM